MRKIKKKLKTTTYEILVYNRITKQEEVITRTVSEVEEFPSLPDGCMALDTKIISEKVMLYSMDGVTFVRNATVEEAGTEE